MDFTNIIMAIGTAVGSVYTSKKFFVDKTDKKVNQRLKDKFDKVDEHFEQIDQSFTDLKSDIQKLDTKLDKKLLKVKVN